VDRNSKVTALLLDVFIGFVDIGSIIINLSDSDCSKLFPKLIVRHEENAILFF
jgi:hypothetical protein